VTRLGGVCCDPVWWYANGMRYPDGGGLTPTARAKREQVRFDAGGMFAAGISPPEVAKRLRVSRKSAYAWHHTWRAGGNDALASRGTGGSPCRLDDRQVARLQAELDAGPAAHGWTDDQRWTLTRVAQVIRTLFRVCYTQRGVSYLLHRTGWSPQVPVHRAAERDEEAIATWVRTTWPEVGKQCGTGIRGWSSRTKPASR
jgi:transposase